jgi:hypothetical protein
MSGECSIVVSAIASGVPRPSGVRRAAGSSIPACAPVGVTELSDRRSIFGFRPDGRKIDGHLFSGGDGLRFTAKVFASRASADSQDLDPADRQHDYALLAQQTGALSTRQVAMPFCRNVMPRRTYDAVRTCLVRCSKDLRA